MNNKPGKLHFVIACEVIDNRRLMQPHGMIPYTLFKYYGYDSEVVTYRNDIYPYLDNELMGLRIRFLKHLFSRKSKLPFFIFLALNARKIDVLMVYNVKKRPIYYGLIYKLFNPRGFLYAKGDTALSEFNFYVENAFLPYKLYMRFLGRVFLKKCDAISIESSIPYQTNTQVSRDKLLLMPCGLDMDIVNHLGVKRRKFHEKENIVLHVSRMGTKQKNTEHILRSLTLMDDVPEGWCFVFIGSQTNAFKKYVANFLEEYPRIAPLLEFHEHVTDKKQLYDYYSRAKVFCLPSRIESFGNVLVEALHFGVAIASNETIPSVQDLVDKGRNGITFSIEQENDMAIQLHDLMLNQERLKAMSDAAMEYSRMHLVWRDIVAPLDKKIKEHYGL